MTQRPNFGCLLTILRMKEFTFGLQLELICTRGQEELVTPIGHRRSPITQHQTRIAWRWITVTPDGMITRALPFITPSVNYNPAQVLSRPQLLQDPPVLLTIYYDRVIMINTFWILYFLDINTRILLIISILCSNYINAKIHVGLR